MAFLIIELQATVLTVVALHMVVLVHGHHPDGLLGALCWEDWLVTGSTFWCKNRVVVFDTVNIVFHIYSEGDSIQALVTHHTAEAARMVGLAKGLQDHFHYEVSTNKALVCCLLKT